MGIHYRKLSSAVNSLAWLRGTVACSQRFATGRFTIARLGATGGSENLVVNAKFGRIVRCPLCYVDIVAVAEEISRRFLSKK